MAEVEVEDRDNHHHRYISPMSNFPRDLLRTFMGVSDDHSHRNMPVVKLEPEEEEELELSLSLSMKGRFGVDPTAKKMKRATSIPEFVRYEEMGRTGRLVRTTSLPTETEEEWRKRKELQTLQRKRSQKQRNLKALREQQHQRVPTQGTNPGEQGAGGFGEPALPLSLTTRVCGLGLTRDTQKEKVGALLPLSSRVSEPQGTTPMDVRSSASTNSLPDSELKSPAGVAGAVTMRSQSNKHSPPQNKTEDIVRNLLEDMPCVSTKGESPNGKRIEGFLYWYRKGEEVRIVCVCHGSFLTPSEFVKHAGGGEVANPLKHIVVSPIFM